MDVPMSDEPVTLDFRSFIEGEQAFGKLFAAARELRGTLYEGQPLGELLTASERSAAEALLDTMRAIVAGAKLTFRVIHDLQQ